MRFHTPILMVVVGLAPPTAALEKTAARFQDPGYPDWTSGATCAISYYNTCTGWSWVWAGFDDRDVVGVFYARCCTQALLGESLHYLTGANNCGYGGTGTISVMEADSVGNAVGPPLASRIVCTLNDHTVWYPVPWNVPVPEYFLLRVAWTHSYGADYFWSDHPAAGPTGPPAVGVCYPSTRTPHTLGSLNQGPWQPLNDGVGNVEFQWVARLTCPVHVEDRTWGSIKALYR